MKTSLMTEPHHLKATDGAPWSWSLAPSEVRTLPAATVPRWLRVDAGRVWVTERRRDAPAEDLWLQAGESLSLPAGTTWIAEAWPQAQLSLLLAQPAPTASAVSSRAWWQSTWVWPWLLPNGAGRHGLRA